VGGQNLFIVQFKAEFFVSRDTVEMDAIQTFAKKKAGLLISAAQKAQTLGIHSLKGWKVTDGSTSHLL
jgi:hypothetical protein